MYFLYVWAKNGNYFYLLLALVFATAASMVKFHGIAFMIISGFYLLVSKHSSKKIFAILPIVVITAVLSVYLDVFDLLLWRISKIADLDVQYTGYSMYVTYLAPDYYTLPFVFLFFLGISAVAERTKLIFLLMPVSAYTIIFTAGPGLGIRHFLVVFPYMAILAARGVLSENIKWKRFLITSAVYLSTLTLMIALAPKVPHPVFVIPDISPEIRLATFSLGFLLILFKKFKKMPEVLVTITAIACLLNTAYFISLQKAYPDKSDAGLEEAGKWINLNTLKDAVIQSTTGELESWKKIHLKAHPESKYPRSTYLDYYTSRRTVAVPDNESELLRRIEKGEIDYIVVFTHFILTESDEAKPFDYVRKYIYAAPKNCELVYRGYNSSGGLQFIVYRVLKNNFTNS